ncbi:MAG: sugar ABC transporter permease [Catenulispora sp.]|nr:sugar ABC transporter permease [Catenulispora sp.]
MAVTHEAAGAVGRRALARRARAAGATRHLPLAPALILLVLFFLGPVIWSVYSSFTNAALTGEGAASPQWVGLENFRRLFSDPNVSNGIWLTVVFVLGSAVIGQNLLGLAIALLMRGRSKTLRGIVGAVVVSAWVLPEVVSAFIWYAFLGQDGTLNAVMKFFGMSGQNWLYSDPMLAVIIANIWRGTAFSMLVYNAALADVPSDVQEAAALDGATGWRRLWSVTLPLIRASIVTNLMLITLQTLSVFTLIYVMTAGGPGFASATLPVLMYQQAFKFSEIGYGTAISLLLLVIGAVFSFIYVRVLKPGA